MKVKVKTLQGKQFEVEINETDTIAEVKSAIQASIPDLSSGILKLIHAGKILNDDAAIFGSLGIAPDSFIVSMVTKPKRAPVPAVVPKTAEKPASTSVGGLEALSAAAAAATPVARTPASTRATADSTPAAPNLNPETISQLMDMGFPEDMVRAALQAAQGNPDIAVEFLMTGIPDGIPSSPQPFDQPLSRSQESIGLARLREHPHFNALRRLVQANPGSLQQVLESIGEQDPELLTEIHANQTEFIAMMNEPLPAEDSSASMGSSASSLGMPMDNPAAFGQMLLNLSPEMQSRMALGMGLSPEQLRHMAQVIGNTPPEQLQQMFAGMGGSGFGELSGMPARNSGRSQVVRLTELELAAVNRLMELGFDQNDAAQAYLACDKDEALAANYLMDNIADIREMGEPSFGSTPENPHSGGNQQSPPSSGRNDESKDNTDDDHTMDS